MKTIYVTPRKGGKKRYQWSANTKNVYRSPVGPLFNPSKKKIGTAKKLEDTVSLIKSHAGNVKSVDIK